MRDKLRNETLFRSLPHWCCARSLARLAQQKLGLTRPMPLRSVLK
jgi:hypothetical protein